MNIGRKYFSKYDKRFLFFLINLAYAKLNNGEILALEVDLKELK